MVPSFAKCHAASQLHVVYSQTSGRQLCIEEVCYVAQMHFEHGFCINCWYKDLDSPQVKHPPFVVHFAGCQMCTGYHPEKLGECATEFVRSYAEALVRLNDEVTKGNL